MRRQLFLQNVVRSGELQLMEISTQMNPTELFTKAVTGPHLKRCLQMMPGLSHRDWPEDEQNHAGKREQKTTMLLAMLVEVMIEQEQQADTGLSAQSCATRELSVGLSVNKENEDMNLTELVLLIVVAFESAVLALIWCRARCCIRRCTYRSMAVQSPTTYTEIRGILNPRFQPLPDYQVGAWEQRV